MANWREARHGVWEIQFTDDVRGTVTSDGEQWIGKLRVYCGKWPGPGSIELEHPHWAAPWLSLAKERLEDAFTVLASRFQPEVTSVRTPGDFIV